MNPNLLKYQKPLMIGWIITTLAIIGYHAQKLNLLDEPAASASSPVMVSVDVNQRKLYAHNLSRAEKNQSIDHVHRLLTKTASAATETNHSAFQKITDTITNASPALPVLSGILETRIIHGDPVSYAVLDSRYMKIRERIRGFTIRNIEPEGVVVVRDGKHWFIPAPTIPFSYQQ